MVEAGVTFWFRQEGSPKPHLYVIISDHMPETHCLVVNITKWRQGSRRQVIDIPVGEPLLVSGWKTRYRSTLYRELFLFPRPMLEEIIGYLDADADRVPDPWLIKLRKAAIQLPRDADADSVLSNHLQTWL